METTVKIPNREIALAAFDRLRRKKRTEISPDKSKNDWKKDTGRHKRGGKPKTGYGQMAHFHCDGETEMETEKYERLKEENE